MKTTLKMMMLCLSLLITGYSTWAQIRIQQIDWLAKPELHKIAPAFTNESAVIISDRRVHEYVKDAKDNLVVNITNHRIIRVNNDRGVETYNKIYIPVSYDAAFQEIKARVITANGKVVDLPKEKILDVEEEGRAYKKFAVEGVEIGSEIEYIIRQQKQLYFFGLEVFQTGGAPCQEAEFMLSVPDYLVFTTKGYNGFKVSADTVIGSQRITYAQCKNIPALEEEKYAQADPFLKNVQYKLSYNLNKEKDVRLFTWNQLAKNVFDSYTRTDDKETKAVAAFVKNIDLTKATDTEDKIVALEDYLKTNISINQEGIGEDADKIERIIKTRVASHEGLVKLFVQCMDQLGINFQIVFPSKRDDIPLDEKLENFRLIDDLVFYFPETGQYLEPTNISFRYPYIQPLWSATRGLFLRSVVVGNMRTAYASFDNIPVQSFEKSNHDIVVNLKLNSSLDSVVMHSKQLFTGYSAAMYRPAFHFLPKERLQDFTMELMQSVSKSKNITNIQVQNSAMTDGFSNKPLSIEGDITSADLIEVAGKKILLKLGEVIGPQEQMYQEKPRQLPISIEFPHSLDRDITFEIPAGYTIKNPEDMKFNIAGADDAMGFISTYTIQGNVVNIKLHEYYKLTEYPLTQFEEFRKVINAAADFNKVVLVLEKQ